MFNQGSSMEVYDYGWVVGFLQLIDIHYLPKISIELYIFKMANFIMAEIDLLFHFILCFNMLDNLQLPRVQLD